MSPPAWIDTHCHLDAAEFAADRAAVYQRACEAGMVGCLVPSVSMRHVQDVENCCRDFPACVPAYGIHPLYTPQATLEDLEQLDAWLTVHPAVAVGEIGLDGFVPSLDWQRQMDFFMAQLSLARKHDLPVILHLRRAVEAVIQALKRIPVRGGVAHAFNGSTQQAQQLIDMGFCLGFGGAMTFTGSSRIRRLATDLPLSAMVLETDAPDISPAWLYTTDPVTGKNQPGRNEPGELPAIAQVMADLRQMPVADLLDLTRRNALGVFPAWEKFVGGSNLAPEIRSPGR